MGGWVEGATAECGGGRRQEWKPRLTHCLKGKGQFQGYAEVPAGRGEVAQEGLLRAGKPRRVPRSSETVQLWRGIQPFDVYIVLQYDSAYLLVVFCLIVQSEALQGNCCFTGRRASTCSLCNAYAPMLTLSSVSVTYNSGSLLFLPHYFGKKITALEKKKKKPFYNHQGGQTFSKLQSILKILTRKHLVKKLKGAKAGSGVISGNMRLEGRQNSVKEKGLLVLMLLFFLFFWLHQLSASPAQRSFLILSLLFLNPPLSISKRWNVKWSQSISETTNLVFPNASQILPEPVWQSPGWRVALGTPACAGGSRGWPDPAAARPAEHALSFLEAKRIKSFYKSLCRKSYFCWFS